MDDRCEGAFNQSPLGVFGQDSQLHILRIESLAFTTPLLPLRVQLLDLSRTAYDTAFTKGVLPPSLLSRRLGAKYQQNSPQRASPPANDRESGI
jgi:hypothetical protein